MRGWIPSMRNCPESDTIGIGAVYWIVFVICLPNLMSWVFLASSFRPQYTDLAWGAIGYYVINFLAVIAIFRKYLADAFFNVRVKWKVFVKTVVIAAAMLVGILLILEALAFVSGWKSLKENLIYVFPNAELPLWLPSGIMLELPVWGTLCLSLLVPVTMCCLYYAISFAPLCCESKPWLGYLVVVLISAIPRAVWVWTVGMPIEQLVLFFVQLPWHLIACWSYQKTDTVWAPISVYAIVNLLGSLCILLLRAFLA